MQRKWRRTWKRAILTALVVATSTSHTQAIPQSGQVTAGTGTITQTSQIMTVNQTSNRLAINWDSFNIAGNERVQFIQPSVSAVALNRVIGADPSSIYGQLTANGRVFLVNPNGILFAPGAQVDVGGLVGSTLQISDKDFMDGNYRFTLGAGLGRIVNQGRIATAEGGYVALLAPDVRNEGVIVSQRGSVLLGAGSQATLDYSGDGKINLAVKQSALNAFVANKGVIQADGGVVVMSARSASNLIDTVVNNEGVIQARSARSVNGVIVLDGGAVGVVNNNGIIDASGKNAAETGGTIKVLGDKVALTTGGVIDASGDSGGGTILVGGNFHGDGAEQNATAVFIGKTVSVKADALRNGDGGKVSVWADEATRFYGTISAAGGRLGGDGGLVETSGKRYLVAQGAVEVGAVQGKGGQWLLDPGNITIQAVGPDSNSGSAPNFSSSANSAVLSTASLTAALNNGGNVTVTTGSGSQAGDITVNDNISKTGGSDAVLTLNAHRDIVLNGADGSDSPVFLSSSGKLGLVFNADSDRNGLGAVVVAKDIATNGGDIRFGSDTNYTVGTYIGGIGTRTISTKGGNLNFYGDTMLAASNGITLDTTNGTTDGAITFDGKIDSANRYEFVSGAIAWTAAKTAAQGATGGGSAVGDTYLVTITSPLENSVATSAGGSSKQAWIGATATTGSNPRYWRWASGPEGQEASQYGGAGRVFFQQTGTSGASISDNGHLGYSNWVPGTEPNNAGGEYYACLGYGSASQWNDYANSVGAVAGYVRETNLANAALIIKAGNGNIVFGGAIGSNKALGSMTVETANNVTANGIVAVSDAMDIGRSLPVSSFTNTAVMNAGTLSVNAVDIQINGSVVSSAGDILLRSAGTVANSNLSTITAQGNLTVQAEGSVTLGSFLSSMTGNVSVKGSLLSLTTYSKPNSYISAYRDITLDTPVSFSGGYGKWADVIISSTGGNGSITFNGQLNLVNQSGLQVDAGGGQIVFNKMVTGPSGDFVLYVDKAAGLTFNDNVNLHGNIYFETDVLNLAAGKTIRRGWTSGLNAGNNNIAIRPFKNDNSSWVLSGDVLSRIDGWRNSGTRAWGGINIGDAGKPRQIQITGAADFDNGYVSFMTGNSGSITFTDTVTLGGYAGSARGLEFLNPSAGSYSVYLPTVIGTISRPITTESNVNLVLANNAVLASNYFGSDGAAITLNGNVQGTTGGLAEPINLYAGIGSVTFAGAIGSGDPTALGNIVIQGSSINLNGPINTAGILSLTSTGTVTQTQPITASGLALLGDGNYTLTNSGNTVQTLAANAGSLNYSNSGNLSIGQVNTATGLTASGAVSVATLNDGNLTVAESITKASGVDAALFLRSNQHILFNAGADVVTSSGKWNVTLSSDTDANATGGIYLDSGTTVSSNGGSILLGGGVSANGYAIGTGNAGQSDPWLTGFTNRTMGIGLNNAQLLSGNGNITLHGKGSSATSSLGSGILATNGSVIQSGNGLIILDGRSSDSSGHAAYGVNLQDAGTVVRSIGSGAIQINGSGSLVNNAGGYGVGISQNALVESTGSSAITITGNAGAASDWSRGVVLDNGARIRTTGTGAISVTGTGGFFSAAGNGRQGIEISDGANPAYIESTGAALATISLNGTAGVNSGGDGVTLWRGSITSANATISITGQGDGAGRGITAYNGFQIGNASLTADISLSADSMDLSNGGHIQTLGTVIIQNKNRGRSIAFGTETDFVSSLAISQTELGKVSASWLRVGNSSTGDIAITDPIEVLGAKGLTLITVGNVTETGSGSLSVANLAISAAGFVNLGQTNTVGTVAINAGNQVDFFNGITDLSIASLDGVNGVTATSATITTGGDITLHGAVRTISAGDAAVLSAGGNFINSYGSAALQVAAGGRWLVYSTNPLLDIKDGLIENQHLYNKTYLTSPPSTIPSGNTFLYSYQPKITITATGIGIYGNTPVFDTCYGLTFNGDSLNDVLTGTPLYLGVDAASHRGTYTLSLSPESVTSPIGYAIHLDGSYTVNQRPIIVTANDRSKVYGNELVLGTTEFSLSEAMPNGDSISDVTLASGGAAATAHRGATGTYGIGASNAVFGSGQSGDYAVSYTDGILTINQRPINVTANDRTKVYGNELILGTTAFNLSEILPNSDSIEGVSLSSEGAIATAHRGVTGTYTITASDAAFGSGQSSDYAISYTNGNLTIDKRPITVTAFDRSKTYGNELILGTSGFGLSEVLPNGESIRDVTLVSEGATATAHRGVTGTYAITASNAAFGSGESNDYSINYSNGTLTVDKRPINVTAKDRSKIYGDELVLGTTEFKLSEVLPNSDNINHVTLISKGSGAAAHRSAGDSGLGLFGIHANYAKFNRGEINDYQISYQAGTLTVLPAPLTYVADAKSKYVGDPNPVLTGNVTGFVLGETLETATDGAVMFTTNALANSPIGVYSINGNGLTANYKDYDFVQAPGNSVAMTVNDATTRNEVVSDANKYLEGKQGNNKRIVQGNTLGQDGGRSNSAKITILTGNSNLDANQGLADANTSTSLMLTSVDGVSSNYLLSNNEGAFIVQGVGSSSSEKRSSHTKNISVFTLDKAVQRVNGAYNVSSDGTKLTLVPIQHTPEPTIDELKEYKLAYTTISLSNGVAAMYSVGFDGVSLKVYPLDENAIKFIRGTESSGNKPIIALSLLTAIDDIGISIEQINAVYIYTH